MSSNPHVGSSLDDMLEEDGSLAFSSSVALKRVLACQIQQAMTEKSLTKADMAKAMKTSSSALDRFLDPANPSVTLSTIERAANAVGKRLRLELEDGT